MNKIIKIPLLIVLIASVEFTQASPNNLLSLFFKNNKIAVDATPAENEFVQTYTGTQILKWMHPNGCTITKEEFKFNKKSRVTYTIQNPDEDFARAITLSNGVITLVRPASTTPSLHIIIGLLRTSGIPLPEEELRNDESLKKYIENLAQKPLAPQPIAKIVKNNVADEASEKTIAKQKTTWNRDREELHNNRIQHAAAMRQKRSNLNQQSARIQAESDCLRKQHDANLATNYKS